MKLLMKRIQEIDLPSMLSRGLLGKDYRSIVFSYLAGLSLMGVGMGLLLTSMDVYHALHYLPFCAPFVLIVEWAYLVDHKRRHSREDRSKESMLGSDREDATIYSESPDEKSEQGLEETLSISGRWTRWANGMVIAVTGASERKLVARSIYKNVPILRYKVYSWICFSGVAGWTFMELLQEGHETWKRTQVPSQAFWWTLCGAISCFWILLVIATWWARRRASVFETANRVNVWISLAIGALFIGLWMPLTYLQFHPYANYPNVVYALTGEWIIGVVFGTTALGGSLLAAGPSMFTMVVTWVSSTALGFCAGLVALGYWDLQHRIILSALNGGTWIMTFLLILTAFAMSGWYQNSPSTEQALPESHLRILRRLPFIIEQTRIYSYLIRLFPEESERTLHIKIDELCSTERLRTVKIHGRWFYQTTILGIQDVVNQPRHAGSPLPSENQSS